MSDALEEKHQLAGFDEQTRGFNRPVEFRRTPTGYQAILRYERTQAVSPEGLTAAEALGRLISKLQGEGYRQLRSQQSFRGGTYLGSQEPWIEYPDPPEETSQGFLAVLKRWFG